MATSGRLQPHALQTLAIAMEAALQEAHGSAPEMYLERARAVLYAVGDTSSPGLAARVCSGDLAPSVLVRMSDGDLTSDSARAERAGIMDAAVRGAELVDSTMVHSGDVCPECSSVNTKVSLTYSMRDIGKAEIWGSKDREDILGAKHRCEDCGCSWTT